MTLGNCMPIWKKCRLHYISFDRWHMRPTGLKRFLSEILNWLFQDFAHNFLIQNILAMCNTSWYRLTWRFQMAFLRKLLNKDPWYVVFFNISIWPQSRNEVRKLHLEKMSITPQLVWQLTYRNWSKSVSFLIFELTFFKILPKIFKFRSQKLRAILYGHCV